jgi:hypothetical protein
MHQAVGNSLHVLKQWMPPNHLDGTHLLVDTALANAMYTTHSMFHRGLMTTPGVLCFNRDMVMNIPFVADLTLIHDNRQRLIDECFICSNAHCHSYDYQLGQEVLKLVCKPDKLKPQAQGPYDIIVVHANVTLTIQLNAHTTERISTRNVKPFLQNGAVWFSFILIRVPLPSVQPLEAECAVIHSHISVMILLIHNPILCEESVPHSGMIHDQIHSDDMDPRSHPLSKLQTVSSLNSLSINCSSLKSNRSLMLRNCTSGNINNLFGLGTINGCNRKWPVIFKTYKTNRRVTHCFHRLHFENYSYLNYRDHCKSSNQLKVISI